MTDTATRPVPPEILAKFAAEIPDKYIKQKPDKSRADYVPHPIVRQYLLALCDAHREHVVREVAIPEKGIRKKDGSEYTYTKVAMLVRLEVCIDGVWYGPWEEWGESENEKNPWKSAQSDAIKRLVAMHLGLGLHLWARDHYFLPAALANKAEVTAAAASVAASAKGSGAVDDGNAEEDSSAVVLDIPAARGDNGYVDVVVEGEVVDRDTGEPILEADDRGWPDRVEGLDWDDVARGLAEALSVQVDDDRVVSEIRKRKNLMRPVHTMLSKALPDDEAKDRLLRGVLNEPSWKLVPAERLQKMLAAEEAKPGTVAAQVAS